MSPTSPQQSVALQALLDQQQAAFSELMHKQFSAMAEEDYCERQELLWKNFNDAHSLGFKHALELASRITRHASHN